MCFLLTLTQQPLFWATVGGAEHPAFASKFIIPASPPAFASKLAELALAAVGRMFEAIVGSLDRRGDKS